MLHFYERITDDDDDEDEDDDEDDYDDEDEDEDEFSFSALTLLVGRQEGHPTCKKTGCWFLSGDDLAGAYSSCSPVVNLSPPPLLSFASMNTG